MRALELGDIDALAVEAEPPAEGREQEADRNDAPAFVAEGGFVDGCVVPGIVEHLRLSFVSPASALLHARLFMTSIM